MNKYYWLIYIDRFIFKSKNTLSRCIWSGCSYKMGAEKELNHVPLSACYVRGCNNIKVVWLLRWLVIGLSYLFISKSSVYILRNVTNVPRNRDIINYTYCMLPSGWNLFVYILECLPRHCFLAPGQSRWSMQAPTLILAELYCCSLYWVPITV